MELEFFGDKVAPGWLLYRKKILVDFFIEKTFGESGILFNVQLISTFSVCLNDSTPSNKIIKKILDVFYLILEGNSK